MCLIAVVEAPGIPRDRAGTVSQGFKSSPTLQVRAVRVAKQHQGSRFELSGSGNDCACSLLSDVSNDSKPIYSLHGTGLQSVTEALEYLIAESADSEITLEIAYVQGAWAARRRVPLRRLTVKQAIAELGRGIPGTGMHVKLFHNAG